MLIIPVFVPHAGCPHDCCFCNQRKISGRSDVPDQAEIRRIIDRYLDIIPNYDDVQIAFFGGSFTGIPRATQTVYLETAAEYIRSGLVSSVRISTRPDYINKEILAMLQAYAVRTIELGAQSMDDTVLKNAGRGHTAEDTVRAAALIRSAGFELGLQTMTGLPGASEESDLETGDRILALRPALVRIYPTIVIKDTLLHTMYERGDYIPPSLEKTVALCAALMVKYESVNIKVIRMGLHASDGIGSGSEIVAGPYHPAFGQLVRSHLAYERLPELGNVCDGVFTAYVPRSELCVYIGQNRCNVTALKEQYGYRKVLIKSMN